MNFLKFFLKSISRFFVSDLRNFFLLLSRLQLIQSSALLLCFNAIVLFNAGSLLTVLM